MEQEATFCMLKPGGLQRRIVGDVIGRIERKGLKIVALKLIRIARELCEEHYSEHRQRPFFDSLVGYMCSGPVIAMVVQGPHAIAALRTLCGATNPMDATVGSIRADLALTTQNNIIHASDSAASAAREIGLFFDQDDILDWEDSNAHWLA